MSSDVFKYINDRNKAIKGADELQAEMVELTHGTRRRSKVTGLRDR